MASNAAGQIIWQERLEPYGRKSVLSNSAAGGAGADQGFHGKSRDEETGLIYFGARHYHPLLGRFLSMDPVEAQSDNLHSFNRYAFANNNPYKYTDPDGQLPLLLAVPSAVSALTPIVSGLAIRFAATRVYQFGLSVAAAEVGLAVPGAAVVAGAATVKAAKPFALGIREHLGDFARARGAETYKNLPDPNKWKSGVLDALADPNRRVHFNLDGVDVWQGVQRASSGRGGATDWELLQIKQNPQFWDSLQFWKNGQQVPNPFK
jgi:RHS repeat-associated protein